MRSPGLGHGPYANWLFLAKETYLNYLVMQLRISSGSHGNRSEISTQLEPHHFANSIEIGHVPISIPRNPECGVDIYCYAQLDRFKRPEGSTSWMRTKNFLF